MNVRTVNADQGGKSESGAGLNLAHTVRGEREQHSDQRCLFCQESTVSSTGENRVSGQHAGVQWKKEGPALGLVSLSRGCLDPAKSE